MKRWLVLAMTLVVALGLLAGCGSDTSKSGKHAGLGLFWFGETLDPTHEWDAWTLTRIGAGETLATVDKDMTFQPQLADSWENGLYNKCWGDTTTVSLPTLFFCKK